MKPAYFDLTVANPGKARALFAPVFGWHFERFAMPYEYDRIQAGEPGIDGGTGPIADAPMSRGRPMTLLTIPVPDLSLFLSKVGDAGRSVMEPRTAIPGVGWYATCAEPGGLMFGLMQADATVR